MNISNKQIDFYDVVIVGGGMVGAAQAQALLKQNKRVLLVEQTPPKQQWLESVPLRVSAVNLFSEDYLRELGIWSFIDGSTRCFFEQLATWDNPNQKLIFSAEEIDKSHLGHLVRNEALQLAAYEAFAESQKNENLVLTDAMVLDIENRAEGIGLTFNSGGAEWKAEASLLIAADGANSQIRQLIGIGITGWDYQQHCFSITVKTQFPTQSITWQEFQPSGPKAFLPLEDGYACLIWYDHPTVISSLMALSNEEIKRRVVDVFPPLPGDFEVIKHAAFPLTRRQANDYFKNRVVLVGDAAHTINPLAGQGVNLGYKDVACLSGLLSEIELTDELKLQSALTNYERKQKLQSKTMSGMMDLCYKLFSNDNASLSKLRSGFFSLANRTSVAKKLVLKKALGY